uniref:Uncharacterized protein n=1 Tax=Culex tarsalis TaxID=7177 RepID=A0A1Q3FTM8_CULTA
MSFSSQRTFFWVPFHDEEPRLPERKRSNCQLKSYHSCSDLRVMSIDPKVTAQYTLDVVHKARWPRVRMRPSSGLTREYLMFVETEELVDFVMCFMTELKKAKTQLAEFEHNQRSQQEEQLQLVQRAADQKLVQQRSEIVDQAKVEEELADLKETILSLKSKANRCDCLERENNCLRKKIQCLRKQKKPEVKEKCEEKTDCGDSPQVDCDRIKAEMALIRNYCEELKQQKRTLMEELQRNKINHCKISDLRNQLIQEQCSRGLLQEKFDNLQIQHDIQAIELERKKHYITMCNRRLEKS